MRLRRHRRARLIAGADGGLLDLLALERGVRATASGLQLCGVDGTTIEVETGGTTGTPKRIRRSGQSWVTSFRTNAGIFGIGPDARVACLGSMAHSIALYAMCEAAHLGAGLLPLGGIRPDRQARALNDHAATHLWLTPTQLNQIARFGPFPALRWVLIGGGALDEATGERARQAFPGAAILPFYGTSEASFITLDGIAYPGVEIALRDRAIHVRSPLVFDGYARGGDPHVARDGDWLAVGELGAWRPDGRLDVLGRVARLVNVADQLVSPEPAERLLSGLAGCPVAVVARPDPARGHVLVAFRIGISDAGRDARLLRTCRERLGPLAAPRAIHPVRTMPMLPSGKPNLAALASLIPAAR